MRKQLIKTVESLMTTDPRIVVLLGDIGVFSFRQAFAAHPARIYNIGICEQSMISTAAGLSREGLIPVVHSIAPFLVERSMEQLKVGFGYQSCRGNFVSVGGSYDYAALGCTHHCPGDVAALRTVPNMRIVVPGHPAEFDRLFRQGYAGPDPTYFRLSERSNPEGFPCDLGRAHVVRNGTRATVIAVGPMLARTITAVSDLDVTVLYYATVAPFDGETLARNAASGVIVVVEPFYEGTLAYDVALSAAGRSTRCLFVGVPRRFVTSYGKPDEMDEACGLTSAQIRRRVEDFL